MVEIEGRVELIHVEEIWGEEIMGGSFLLIVSSSSEV